MKMRQTIVLMMVLMAGSSCWAQVRETTTYKDGSYYTGERDAKGRRHGNGLMVFANGDRYEGSFVQGHMTRGYVHLRRCRLLLYGPFQERQHIGPRYIPFQQRQCDGRRLDRHGHRYGLPLVPRRVAL